MVIFDWPPTPSLLQWLSGGQWANRLVRSQRLYILLRRLYGPEAPLLAQLSQPFHYQALAQQLFAPSHDCSETAAAERIMAGCRGTACLCQQSGATLLFEQASSLESHEWLQQAVQLTGLTSVAFEAALVQRPFGVVHRVLRDDLKLLAQQGWLKAVGRGKWTTVPAAEWPRPPETGRPSTALGAALSPQEQLIVRRSLDSVAFVQPQLEVILDKLWRQIPAHAQPQGLLGRERPQRIFTHLDYILPDDVQEQVDSHQQQIEALWQTADGGVIQFENWLARAQRSAWVTVYPVCLHYARRAKYLSAYGLNPDGQVGWHNYRLDRILSPRLNILSWDDSLAPVQLKALHDTGQLPTPEQVQAQLDDTWGFNFYLPKALLIMRFPPTFARWYVQDTDRHPTFGPIAYGDLAELVRSHIPASDAAAIVQRLARCPETDAYYWGWIRVGDINVTMRLRDWRPNGEVIAPLAVRRQMAAEVKEEARYYTSTAKMTI